MTGYDEDNRIYYIVEYHKYWLIRKILKNPKCGRDSLLILDTKDKSERNHNTAVKYYAKKIAAFLSELHADSEGQFYIAIAPSSTAFKHSPGLISIHELLRSRFDDLQEEILLERFKAVPKATDGGARDEELHMETIRLDSEPQYPDDLVIVLDDVTTSGSTLRACGSILRDAGYTNVLLLALGKSVD